MFLEFGIINYKLLIPCFYPFCYQIRRVIHNGDKKPFYELFTNYCGYLFSGLVYLIIILRMRKKTKKPNENGENIFLELKDMDSVSSNLRKTPSMQSDNIIKLSHSGKFENQIIIEKNKMNFQEKKRKYLFILMLAGIYLIPMFLDSYCSSNPDIRFKTSSSISLLFCLISYVILSRLILGLKIYRHQIFSLIIIIVCNVITIILTLIGEDNSNIVVNMVLMFVILSLYALYNVLEKRYFNRFMDSPYHLMFVIGFISLIIILLYETITVLAFGKDRVFNGVFYQIELNIQNIRLYPLLFIGDVLSAFLWIGGIQLTIYFFSPCHFIISESVSQILSTIINNSLENHATYIKAIVYTLFLIIFLAALIYNEVIIINLFSLEKNTQKHIENRANNENDIIFYDEQIGQRDTVTEDTNY